MEKYCDEEKKNRLRKYSESRSKNLTRYISLIGSSFQSRIDVVGQLIGDAHEPSLGRYKENLLKQPIREHLPDRFDIGTGFVAFPYRIITPTSETNDDWFQHDTHDISKELDLIVYNKLDCPQVYKDGDFVILRPESGRAIIEVKGYVKPSEITTYMNDIVILARQWSEYNEVMKPVIATYDSALIKPSLILVNWSIKPDKNGRPLTDGTRLRKIIVDEYKNLITQDDLKSECFPLLNMAIIYSECIVHAAVECGCDGDAQYGYDTAIGTFLRGTKESYDSTLAQLISPCCNRDRYPITSDFLNGNSTQSA
jgi:hypothetical protein